MFENITLGNISAFLVFLVGLISGVEFLLVRLRKLFDKKLEPLNTKLVEIGLSSDKNYLVRFLADVEQGNPVDETEIQRFYEIYSHYIKDGGNSYVKHKVEKLQKEGKL